MADNVKPRVRVPGQAQAGEVITVKTMIRHPMDSGHRRDAEGSLVPRSIIYRFTCAFNGAAVVDVAMGPGVSTNPYYEFQCALPASGRFTFTWYGEDGAVYTAQKDIEVTP